MKWAGSIFRVWNVGVRNKYFTYEMEHSQMEIIFIFILEIAYEIFSKKNFVFKYLSVEKLWMRTRRQVCVQINGSS